MNQYAADEIGQGPSRVHPIDDAYQSTADQIGERLNKIKAEVGEIELLATTKRATLYVKQLNGLRASAVLMSSRVDELKALIGNKEDTAPPEKERQTFSLCSWFSRRSWNDIARDNNSRMIQVDVSLMPLQDHGGRSVSGFPSTVLELNDLSVDKLTALFEAFGLQFTGDIDAKLRFFACFVGVWGSLGSEVGREAGKSRWPTWLILGLGLAAIWGVLSYT